MVTPAPSIEVEAAAPAMVAAKNVEPASAGPPPEPPQIDPDGNDDEEDPGTGSAPAKAHWEKVGTPPLALTRICDLTPFNGALYAAHANQPLGTDGATITRYTPGETNPFRVAFDWNRPGEPVKGGGAGQGFLRVHAIGGKLYVPDADPPYGGFAIVDGAEGYVFVSDEKGVFAPPRAPHFRPPATAAILPRAYHVLDAIRFRGALYASTGSVPPKERAWRGPSPGALHRGPQDPASSQADPAPSRGASPAGSRWMYEVDYPYPWQNGVWRLTYLVRFKDRLFAGIQDYDGRDPNDFIVFDPPPSSTGIQREDAHPKRITRSGASGTLRWWVDTRAKPARLYWLAWTRDGIVLRVTTDGEHWAALDLPEGVPTDITRFRDAVVVLTDTGLYRLQGPAVDGPVNIAAMNGVADVRTTLIAPVEKKKSPFEVKDFFCTAPLAVMNGVLYAGGQRGGTLYRLEE